MYRWAHPEYLQFLWGLPFLALGFFFYTIWRRRAWARFGDPELRHRMARERSIGRPVFRFLLWLLAVASLIVALANPQIGTKLETVKREGMDLVFALDVSRSMLAQDVAPDRLENAKRIVSLMADELAGDRVGMIIYAGSAYPQLPITTDYGALQLALRSADPNSVSSQGTALETALEMALGYFDPESPAGKVLVLLTDGEDHEEGWEQAAGKAREMGITVIPVGIGTEKGGPIPERTFRGQPDFKRDQGGEVVITSRHADVLKEIAAKTQGVYIDGNIPSRAVETIIESLNGFQRQELESQVYSGFEDQFQWFLWVSLILLALEFLISDRKQHWLRRLGWTNETN
ncbi:MAG: VWA domain-containing protein [Bacteroidota bacterium]|nr:VWA domain-containing protein [Bacteroidota bacterium]